MIRENHLFQLRKFDEHHYLIDKLAKDVIEVSSRLYNLMLEEGVFSVATKLDSLSYLADYNKTNFKKHRNFRYGAIEDTFYDIKAPLFVTIEVTNSCNLSCNHCYHGDDLNNRAFSDDFMSIADFEHLFQQLSEAGTVVIVFTGGEPFMRKDFPEILRAATKYDFLIQVFTNAVLFDNERQQLCEDCGVDKVQISLYGDDLQVKQSHKGYQSRVKANLTAALAREFCLVATVTPTHENIEFAENISAWLVNLDIPFNYNASIRPTHDGDSSTKNGSIMYHANLLSKLCKFEDFGLHPVRDRLDLKPCNAGHNVLGINYRGNIYPCIAWPERVGNIKYEAIQDVFINHRMKDIRNFNIADFSKCSSCTNVNSCGFCPGSNYVKNFDSSVTNTDVCGHTEARKIL